MDEHYQDGSDLYRTAISTAANNADLIMRRQDLARFASAQLQSAGRELHLSGHIIGSDRTNRSSPFGHGDDEAVAISVLLRVAGELTSASADLFADGRRYAAAALLRQMVEVEYLAWAFESRDGEARRWLRSDKQERLTFFTPAKLRTGAGERFRSKDYGYHCELGGHPVPQAGILLEGEPTISQLLLVDLLGHVGRIWDHLLGWAKVSDNPKPLLDRAQEMSRRFGDWKMRDSLTRLPPPP